MSTDKNLRPAFNFKNIHELPAGFEKELAKKVNTRDVYIIVHPSYFLFFGKNNPLPSIDTGRNVVTTFLETDLLEKRPFIDLMKNYERTEMDFLSRSSDEGKLVLLIMPGKYLSSKIFLYRDGEDEYARYLNDIINENDAVFYVESIRSSTGKMTKKERRALRKFLKTVGARNIYIGGGYVGRCQKEVYKIISRMWSDNRIAIIPDLSAFSPRDVSDSTAKMLLTDDMRLNSWSASYYIKNGILKNFEVNLKNFPIETSDDSTESGDNDFAIPVNDGNNDNIDLSPESDDPGIQDYSFNTDTQDQNNFVNQKK